MVRSIKGLVREKSRSLLARRIRFCRSQRPVTAWSTNQSPGCTWRQTNGTSGYGCCTRSDCRHLGRSKEPFVLCRHQAYIGTIDDLVTKEWVASPSHVRRERSTAWLREDNADRRLMPIAREITSSITILGTLL